MLSDVGQASSLEEVLEELDELFLVEHLPLTIFRNIIMFF